ncbi:MAG: hypothetical protein Q9165_002488 [Trypethelium subeluteriae]
MELPKGTPVAYDTFEAKHVTTYLEEYADSHTYQVDSPNNPSPGFWNITVLGGGKSAADMVYAAVKANKHVSWIVRRSGEGPGIFVDPTPPDGYRNMVERGATQNATALNPSSFRPMQPWALELHQTPSKRDALGSKLFAADQRYKDHANYSGRQNALACFAKLEPSTSFFWTNGPIGMVQHDDFWDLISQKVLIYRADPIGTTASSILLEDGKEVPTDVLFCGTGWSSEYSFLSPSQIRELGLPHDRSSGSDKDWQHWQPYLDAADKQIISKYPILADPPPGSTRLAGDDIVPARLYRGIASLGDASIVFLGRAHVSNSFRGADTQAIWATAYWDGHIKLPPREQLRWEVAYMNAFSKRRYPTRGVDGVNFHGDLVWYTDSLITEAGLSSHRKGWWSNGDEPCLADDMRDCKDEYLTKYGTIK